MAEKTIPNEKAIIEEIVRRKSRRDRIPAEKMHVFKAILGEEIERTGKASQQFVDDLLRRLNSGEL